MTSSPNKRVPWTDNSIVVALYLHLENFVEEAREIVAADIQAMKTERATLLVERDAGHPRIPALTTAIEELETISAFLDSQLKHLRAAEEDGLTADGDLATLLLIRKELLANVGEAYDETMQRMFPRRLDKVAAVVDRVLSSAAIAAGTYTIGSLGEALGNMLAQQPNSIAVRVLVVAGSIVNGTVFGLTDDVFIRYARYLEERVDGRFKYFLEKLRDATAMQQSPDYETLRTHLDAMLEAGSLTLKNDLVDPEGRVVSDIVPDAPRREGRSFGG